MSPRDSVKYSRCEKKNYHIQTSDLQNDIRLTKRKKLYSQRSISQHKRRKKNASAAESNNYRDPRIHMRFHEGETITYTHRERFSSHRHIDEWRKAHMYIHFNAMRIPRAREMHLNRAAAAANSPTEKEERLSIFARARASNFAVAICTMCVYIQVMVTNGVYNVIAKMGGLILVCYSLAMRMRCWSIVEREKESARLVVAVMTF